MSESEAMNLRNSAYGMLIWIAKFLAGLLISIIILFGTYLAAYVDFGRGMALFWLGCLLATMAEAYWIYALVRGRFDATRVYMRSLLSIILTATLGYGGAYFFYYYATSASLLSNPVLAVLLPRHAVSVIVLTSVIYSTLRILFAAARAAAAYYVSHSRLSRTVELAEKWNKRARAGSKLSHRSS